VARQVTPAVIARRLLLKPWHLAAAAGGLVLLGGLVALVVTLGRGAPPEPVVSHVQAPPNKEVLTVDPVREGQAVPVAQKPQAAELLPEPLVEEPRPPAVLVRAELLPPPEVEMPPAVRPAAVLFKRRDRSSEEELRRDLAQAPEVGLFRPDAVAVFNAHKDSHNLSTRTSGSGNPASVAPLLQVRPDLNVLPLRDGVKSMTPLKAAASLHQLSRKLHAYLKIVARLEPGNRERALGLLRQALEQERRGRRPEWLRPEAVPTLTQMLMSEDARGRRLLVDLLARIPGGKASETLARRAMFDLDAGIREAAIESLRERRDEARPVLLAGLRHVWAPAADHAAEALVALKDRAAVPGLIDLLGQPDPAAPKKRGKLTVVSELVRLNHLTNCLVCHAPSVDRSGLVQGEVPGMSQLVPKKSYGGGGGSSGGGSGGGSSIKIRMTSVWARADIVFLRQDFSVQLPVVLPLRPAAGPVPVRFDYTVRTRIVSPGESRQLRTERGDPTAYRQREAVLFALRELTGEDPGSSTLAWQRHFPHARDDLQAARFVDALSTANPKQREHLLEQYQASTWPLHTRVLAWAVYRLQGAAREQARTALDRRLARMSPAELRGALRHDLPEVRESAIRACLRQPDLVPALIPLLEDSEPLVARQARQVLAELTDQSFERSSEWLVWWHRKNLAVAAR
jgi:HEAT repeat protein